MSNHPLQSYYSFLESNNFASFISDFNDHNRFITYRLIKNPHETFTWNENKKAYIVSNEIFDDTYELTLNDHIFNTINGFNKTFIQEIRNFLWSRTTKENSDYCQKILNDLRPLIIHVKNLEGIEKDIAVTALEEIESFLSININRDFVEKNIKDKKKLIWKGKINTLVTLFFDLSQNTNNLKTQFIEYDRQGLTDFIVESFLDNDGREIEPSTVYRILDVNPFDLKKAKKRIEISE